MYAVLMQDVFTHCCSCIPHKIFPKVLEVDAKTEGKCEPVSIGQCKYAQRAGKKPNARHKSSSKSATKRIKELIAEAESEQLTSEN